MRAYSGRKACPFEQLLERVKQSKMVASELKGAGNEQIKVAPTEGRWTRDSEKEAIGESS